jgi:hypothetical protein
MTKKYVKVMVDVGERVVHFKFTHLKRGSGIVIHRENPDYLELIGEWFCKEVEAMPPEKKAKKKGKTK